MYKETVSKMNQSEYDYFKLYNMYTWHKQKRELFQVDEVYIKRSVISIFNDISGSIKETEDNLILIPEEEVKEFLKNNKIRGTAV